MSYCTDCGTELSADAAYCPECGAAVNGDSEAVEETGDVDDDTATLGGAYIEDGDDKTSWSIVIAAAIMGFFPGFLLWWGFDTIGGGGIVFLIGWIGSTVYLRNKRLVSEVVGSGLYITALLLPLVPVLFYVPNLIGDPQTASEAGTFVGSFIGMFVYGVVFAIIGVIIAAIGYFAKKRAAKKLEAAS
ncbi:zinc-ribbon domain-containing protein [Halobacterium sp. KA-6]|uniref:zinc-ribbon domain-containing protein n=1 Tax=Halobacterium sp. KA-6 TaxID=2896368 RepID=UPI001E4938DD|nr:zinc ribbon domain-containing protein [Halobacterium sp. KA-6]MCD2204407.1 zinc ribbon domain-containing protein [Halobacterium sp. KA-6]